MVNRGLLVASQTGQFRGCHFDAELIDDALNDWGFECTRLSDGSATQEAILGAYRTLIDHTQPGDAVVVYYSGHGGRVRDMAEVGSVSDTDWQFIVPTDFDRSTEREFRGIMAGELRALQLELSTKTDNVTTILDCCHAALMSRDPALVPRFLERAWPPLRPGATARRDKGNADVAAALTRPGTVPADAYSNRRAVRLVACLPSESAVERQSAELGQVHGLLTEGLVGLLREAKRLHGGAATSLTWDDVVAPLSAWVLARNARQHVLVEGPSRRRLFSSDQSDATRGWPVEISDDRILIPAAAIFGVGVGDVVALVDPVLDEGDGAELEARVARVEGGSAVLELADGADPSMIRPRWVAHPTRISSRRRAVVVTAPPGADRDAVVAKISASSRLDVVDRSDAPAARVELDRDGLMLIDHEGMTQYLSRRPTTPESLARLTTDLENLAKAADLRELSSGTGEAALDVPVVLRLRLPDRGASIEPGSTVPADSVVVIEVEHMGKPNDPILYANVIELGQVGDRTVLTDEAHPTGLEIRPGDRLAVRDQEEIVLCWADDLPAEPRPETFMAIFSTTPLDVRALGSSDTVEATEREQTADRAGAVQRVVDLTTTGTSRATRSRSGAGREPTRYRVERLEFLLDPGFQADESTPTPVAVGNTRERPTTPRHIEIGLRELVVQRNDTAFSTDARLDAAFLTVDGSEGGVVLRTGTWRLPPMTQDRRLPVDGLTLYDGSVQDFLDIALWLSRASPAVPDLAALIAISVANGSREVDGLSPTSTGAAAEFAVSPGTTAATAANSAARVLGRSMNRSIGFYRTTLPIPGGLTPGRNPASGRFDTTDVAFAYDLVVDT